MNEKLNREMQRFNQLINETDRAYHDAAVRMGLSDSAFTILYTLCSNGGECNIGEICSWGCAKQTVNSALRKLEAEGTIYLKNGDGKRKLVCLTEKGQHLASSTAAKIMEIENEIFASWKSSEVTAYVELTERYLKMFRRKIDGLTD